MPRRKKNKRLTPVQMAKKGLWNQRNEMMTNRKPGEWNNYKLLTQYEYERLMAWVNEPIGLSDSKIDAKTFFDQYDDSHTEEHDANERAISAAEDYLAKEHAKKYNQKQQQKQEEKKQENKQGKPKEESSKNEEKASDKAKEDTKKETPKQVKTDEKEKPDKSDEKTPKKRPAPVKFTADQKVVDKQNKEKEQKHKQMDETIENARKKAKKKPAKPTPASKKKEPKKVDPVIKSSLAITAADPLSKTHPVVTKQVRDIPDFMVNFVHKFLVSNRVDTDKLSMGKQIIYFIAAKMDDLTWHSCETYFSTPARSLINQLRAKNKDKSIDRYAEETHKTNNMLAEILQEVQMDLMLNSESFNDRVLRTSHSAATIQSKADYADYEFGHDGANELMLARLREVVKNNNQAQKARDFSTDRFAHTTHSESD